MPLKYTVTAADQVFFIFFEPVDTRHLGGDS